MRARDLRGFGPVGTNSPKATSGHTPGPWAVFHDHPDADTAKSLGYIRRAENDLGIWNPWGFGSIADCFGCDHPEQEANARLIAAAPEMLDMLKTLESKYAKSLPGSDTHTAIRNLIAKATGQ